MLLYMLSPSLAAKKKQQKANHQNNPTNTIPKCALRAQIRRDTGAADHLGIPSMAVPDLNSAEHTGNEQSGTQQN